MRMQKKLGQQTKYGFTLTEIAIVLGVVGSIIAGIWTAAAHVSANNKAQRAAAQVMQIITNYRTLYAQHSMDVSDWSDITCTGVTANFFPPDVIAPGSGCTASVSGTTTYTGTALINPWNGTVEVWGYQSTPGIIIKYDGLTDANCNMLADELTQSPDVIWEGINATAQWVTTATPGYNPQAISGACTAGGTANVLQLMFSMR